MKRNRASRRTRDSAGLNNLIRFLVAMRAGETPVHIPNTMVKTCTAENTLLETARKDRWLPDLKRKYSISYIIIESTYGGVAQLGEHLPCKQGVKSSNLSISIEVTK